MSLRASEKPTFDPAKVIYWKVITSNAEMKKPLPSKYVIVLMRYLKKGRSAENRKVKWLQHFTALLGEPTKTPPNQTLRKIQIAEHLDIPTGPFTHRNQ